MSAPIKSEGVHLTSKEKKSRKATRGEVKKNPENPRMRRRKTKGKGRKPAMEKKKL